MLRRQLELFFTALGFFTRLPVPTWMPYSTERLNHAARWFPLVGWIVGACGALVTWIAARVLPWPLAVLLGMLATVLLTGAFHEDGLADSADGLGGGWEKTQVLAIMKDSRIGTYGALSLLFGFALKFGALQAMPPRAAVAALLVLHPLSRFAAVSLIRWMRYVREDADARAKPLAQQMSDREWLLAAVCGLLPLVLLRPLTALAVAAGVLLVTLWWARLLTRRLGGYTGDCLGAAQQLAEITGYLVLLAAWNFT
ncbi:adenosylcobinamide-GDP ribazoletransferase [Niveibacterium sp. SC-1]|uniref:adenosylcobinamide-GDP ribazoletransferase n=1 Tax=Niveibacterium sp. SC-1 TaxID=3135646 RepID=UPI0031204922